MDRKCAAGLLLPAICYMKDRNRIFDIWKKDAAGILIFGIDSSAYPG